jgi:hypothetical protein
LRSPSHDPKTGISKVVIRQGFDAGTIVSGVGWPGRRIGIGVGRTAGPIARYQVAPDRQSILKSGVSRWFHGYRIRGCLISGCSQTIVIRQKNDRNPDTSDLRINGLLSTTWYQRRGGERAFRRKRAPARSYARASRVLSGIGIRRRIQDLDPVACMRPSRGLPVDWRCPEASLYSGLATGRCSISANHMQNHMQTE